MNKQSVVTDWFRSFWFILVHNVPILPIYLYRFILVYLYNKYTNKDEPINSSQTNDFGGLSKC